jgi:hypothetical protein
MAARQLPPQGYLLKIFNYDPKTGTLRWRERTPDLFASRIKGSAASCGAWNRRYAGKVAGAIRDDGRRIVGLSGWGLFRASRIIWKIVTGEEPDVVDHINGDPSDDRFHNLRSVSFEENMHNTARRSDNSTGAAGVFFCPHLPRKPWRVRVTCNGKHHNLGYHRTFEEALHVRDAAKRRLGFTDRHGV